MQVIFYDGITSSLLHLRMKQEATFGTFCLALSRIGPMGSIWVSVVFPNHDYA